MKILDARQAYSAQLSTLWDKKQSLTKLLEESETTAMPDVDRVELSRELDAITAQYEETQGVMEHILTRETALYNAEVSRQQADAIAEMGDDMIKMMTIFRRISSGAKVPPSDERRLMEYDAKLYMLAKSSAMLGKTDDKEYDSLWKDEKPTENPDPQEVADNAEISVPAPQTVSGDSAQTMCC